MKPAAGSANLMSPQIAGEDTLGANKRIRDDMISKSFLKSLKVEIFSFRVKVCQIVFPYYVCVCREQHPIPRSA